MGRKPEEASKKGIDGFPGHIPVNDQALMEIIDMCDSSRAVQKAIVAFWVRFLTIDAIHQRLRR
jgi:hypothetical protein